MTTNLEASHQKPMSNVLYSQQKIGNKLLGDKTSNGTRTQFLLITLSKLNHKHTLREGENQNCYDQFMAIREGTRKPQLHTITQRIRV